MENKTLGKTIEEKLLNPRSGAKALALLLPLLLLSIALMIFGPAGTASELFGAPIAVPILIVGILGFLVVVTLLCGLKVVNPNEALVLLFFGKYYGTISGNGFFWVNPFTTAFNPALKSLASSVSSGENKSDAANTLSALAFASRKISLKAMTLNNEKQKVNDQTGNPIEIGVVVIWKVINTAKAAFNVENYSTFVSTQADSAIRQVARLYPYDVSDQGDEKSLRGSSQEIADVLKSELQTRVELAGIEIIEARISHLAYAPEIASAMLQRQQAEAVIAARQKIVEGAVGMVQMALDKLSAGNIVNFDDERKAAMVSNLLVVLCGNRDAQPIVNSGSIY